MNKYQALVDMLEHGNSKGALDALEKLRDEDRETPKTVEEVSLRDFIEEQLHIMLDVTSSMQPKSDKEFIAVALPNLHTNIFHHIEEVKHQTRKERDAEIVEWVKKEIRNAPLEVKMSGSSMILGKLIKHLTTPDHEK